MLPVNDLKFQPPFLGLQNEEEVIGALDTTMQKKIVTKSKTQSEKDRRGDNIHHWNSMCFIFFIHFFHFIGQQQKTGAHSSRDGQTDELFVAFYISEKKK